MKILKLPAASVSARFAAIMLLVLVLPFVALLIVTTGNLSRIQRESANQYLSSNLRTVSATVDQSLKSLEFSHTVIFQDTKFLNAIKRLSPYSEREEYPDFLNTNAIKKRIAESAVTNNYIYSIYAYSFPAQRIFSSKVNWDPKFNYYTGENSEWLQAHLENTKRHPWCITKDINEGKLLISSYREIWDYAMGDSPLGLLSINIDAGVITGMLDEVAPKVPGYTFIIDSKGDIISNQNDSNREVFEQIKKLKPDSPGEGYFSFNIGKGEMFASFYTSPYSGFTYVIATSLNLIQTSVPVMVRLIFLFLLLIAVLAAVTMLLLHRVLSMAENMQKLALENYTSKLVNKEAELRNIQNQLNEHFLYNTLDSIHWLARSGDNLKVCGMVFALANFYRQSLSSGKEAIPVRDVIEMSKNYLFIQKIRMREALEYNFTCDPGLEGALILKNLIQPIIENAIVHGFRGVNRPGSIDVSFRLQGDGMRIAITDNGVGFEPARLEEVRLELNSPYCEEAFALKTVQSQAQIFYGRPVRLNIETSVGMGTTAWLELPLHPVGG